MKKIFYLLLLIAFQFSMSQSAKITAVETALLNLEADDFIGVDGFGNCFYTKNNTVLKKVDSAILQYQNLSLGKITKVDILNPFVLQRIQLDCSVRQPNE